MALEVDGDWHFDMASKAAHGQEPSPEGQTGVHGAKGRDLGQGARPM